MVELEARERIRMSQSDRIADVISGFAGSMLFVWMHIGWFAFWIAANSALLALYFDDFPYGLLTMIVSLEAIFLSTFVLIAQNRQAQLAEKRAKVDLQVNLIAELEVTKIMALVSEIHRHLGLSDSEDEDVERLKEPTHVTELADAVDAAERESLDKAAGGAKV